MTRLGFRQKASLVSGSLLGCLLLGGILVQAAPVVPPPLPIPKEIYGAYAANGNCAAEPRVLVNPRGLFVQSQGKTSGPFPVDVCYSCAGGARYEGIQIWLYLKSAGKLPLVLMFNANEKPGMLEVNNNDPMPLGGGLLALSKAPAMQRCQASSRVTAPQAEAKPARTAAAPSVVPAANPITSPALIPGTFATNAQLTQNVAVPFVSLLDALMAPASLPGNSFYDWRAIENAPGVQWAPLPPEMLDQPTSDGNYFRRRGTAVLGGVKWPVLASGARTMVMSHHFLNPGNPIGESDLVGMLRRAGFTVTPARCPILPGLNVPKWYRLAKADKRTAFLWVIPAGSNRMGREGFTLNLSDYLPPLTPNEKRVYTDSCP